MAQKYRKQILSTILLKKMLLCKSIIKNEICLYFNFGKISKNTKVKDYQVVEAILYRLKTGCQWRELPIKQFFRKKYTWQSVYFHFQKWCKDGIWEKAWIIILKKYKHLLDMSSIQLDGTHSPTKRGGAAVGYQGRKKCKTSTLLIMIGTRPKRPTFLMFLAMPVKNLTEVLVNLSYCSNECSIKHSIMAILNFLVWTCFALITLLIIGVLIAVLFKSFFWVISFSLAFFAQLFRHKTTVIVFLLFIIPAIYLLLSISRGDLGVTLFIFLTILLSLIPTMLSKAFIFWKNH